MPPTLAATPNDLFTLTKNFAGQHSLKAGDVHFTLESYALLATRISVAIESTHVLKREH